MLHTFLSKFADYKAELEKSASKRGDDHHAELKTFVASFDINLKTLQELLKTSNESHTENYKILLSLSDVLQEDIAKINMKIQDIENKLDFAIEKSVKQGESISTINDKVSNNEKKINRTDNKIDRVNNEIKNIGEVTTKRIDNLMKKIMLDLIDVLSKYDVKIYEIPLFEFCNNTEENVNF